MPNLQAYKENSFTHSHSCVLPSFCVLTFRLLLPKGLGKCASAISFRKDKQKVVLLVIYLFIYDSSKSTFFILNMPFDVVLSTFFFKQICILRFLQFKDYNNILLFNQPVSFCFDMYFVICTSSW